jgi:hypothetical protein
MEKNVGDIKVGSMVAVVVRESGEAEHIQGSQDHLVANVLPRVRHVPGIISGLFMTDGLGRTLNVLMFDSEDAARAAVDPIRNAPRPGFLRFEDAALHKVLAHF